MLTIDHVILRRIRGSTQQQPWQQLFGQQQQQPFGQKPQQQFGLQPQQQPFGAQPLGLQLQQPFGQQQQQQQQQVAQPQASQQTNRPAGTKDLCLDRLFQNFGFGIGRQTNIGLNLAGNDRNGDPYAFQGGTNFGNQNVVDANVVGPYKLHDCK